MDGTTQTKLTPADFQSRADAYHAELTAAREKAAAAQSDLDAISEKRITLISEARDYGLTGAYARTLLQRAYA